MCGIYGEINKNENVIINAINGLKLLEYRGYDSAGIAFFNKEKIEVIKKCGKVKTLEEAAIDSKKTSHAVISHTRWATHGKPCDKNAHPFKKGKFAVVHNGIIENYNEIKTELIKAGETFESETDTEVIPMLLSVYYKPMSRSNRADACKRTVVSEDGFQSLGYKSSDVKTCICKLKNKLKGAFALAIMCEDEENKIYVITNGPPIVYGKNNAVVFASDEIAIPEKIKKLARLAEGEILELSEKAIKLYDDELNEKKPKYYKALEKQQILAVHESTYMEKEINETPNVIIDTFNNIDKKKIKKVNEALIKAENVYIVGCGTAYHSGLVGAKYFEKHLSKTSMVEVASEFRYRKPKLTDKGIVIIVSQSGETADSIASAEYALKLGAKLIVITNTESSTLDRMSDVSLLTSGGRELAVAATKSYVLQILIFYLIAAINEEPDKIKENIEKLSGEVLKIVKDTTKIKEIAKNNYASKNIFFLGRLTDFALATESALKLKEVTYMHAESYPAGEIKHGTLALIEEVSTVITIITDRLIKDKSLNAVYEVKARGAKTIVISQFNELAKNDRIDEFLLLPDLEADLLPMLAIIPMQQLALFISEEKGINPDKPRNLAKSVTVE